MPRDLGELFDRALDVPESDRAAWLRDACGDDRDLLAELERLLRADAKATHFLERAPALTVATLDNDVGKPARFGPWRVVRQLGAGGMGEVWLGERDDGAFEQRVAIKQLSYPTPGLLQRFRQERQILANLQHPYIARLIDGGLDEHGVPYLAMEFVDGTPIIDYARDHALDARARLLLFLRVCAAVAYAHQNLVVHRDLKPSNIFVTTDGEPKLLDFGIAKVLATTDAAAQTQTAARLLTPEYAAPEQFTHASTTTAVDVYALGVVLHELLCGARPVRGNTHETTTPSAVARDPEFRRSLRGDLDRILLAALAANPQQRYPSVEALSADIRRHLDGQPISIRRDSASYRAMKFVRRNRLPVAAAIGIVLISVFAAAVSLRQAAIAREQARRADAVRHFMGAVFAQSNPDENKGKPIEAHRLLEEGERQLDRMHDAEPAVRSDIAVLLAQLYRDLGDRDRAVSLLNRTADSDSAQLPADARARALLASAALAIEDRDAPDEGLPRAQTALRLLEEASDPDWHDRAEADRLIGLALVQRTEYTKALAHLRAHAAVDKAHLGGDIEPIANAHVTEGVALNALARFEESQQEFDTGIDMLRRLYGNDSDRVASALSEMAQMLVAKGDLVAAEKWQREVLRIHSATLAAGHPNIFTARHNLLGTIEMQGHFAEALPQRLTLLEESLHTTNTSPLQTINQYDTVGIDYREIGRFAESEGATRQALALMETAQGPRSARSIGLLRHLASTLTLQGHFEEAEAISRDALVIATTHDARTSFRACGLRRDIGRELLLQRRYGEAAAQLGELATDACMIGLVASDPWRPSALSDLSLAQLGAGDASGAYATAQQAIEFMRAAPTRNYNQSLTLLAFGCAALAAGKQVDSETALRDALTLASPPLAASDPRVIEIKTALAKTLAIRDADASAVMQQEIDRDSAAMPEKYRQALRVRTLAVRDAPTRCP